LPAWVVLGIWIGGQFVAVPNALGGDDGGVAYFAHIGGFLAGMVLIPFFKRSDVPLFGANDSPPDRQPGRPIPFSEIRQQARYRYGRRTNDPLRSRVVARDSGSGDDGGDTEDSASPWQAGSGEETRDHPSAGRRGGSVPGFKRRQD
ncbi:MAG: rhomboid family intramembrane serine protease, partial [Rhodobiaceae bacterium]